MINCFILKFTKITILSVFFSKHEKMFVQIVNIFVRKFFVNKKFFISFFNPSTFKIPTKKSPNKSFLVKKYPEMAFLVPNLDIFVSSQNFAVRQIRRCWFQIWQYFFKILTQKYLNKVFLVPNLGIFVSLRNFVNRKIWGCWFQIWQKYF